MSELKKILEAWERPADTPAEEAKPPAPPRPPYPSMSLADLAMQYGASGVHDEIEIDATNRTAEQIREMSKRMAAELTRTMGFDPFYRNTHEPRRQTATEQNVEQRRAQERAAYIRAQIDQKARNLGWREVLLKTTLYAEFATTMVDYHLAEEQRDAPATIRYRDKGRALLKQLQAQHEGETRRPGVSWSTEVLPWNDAPPTRSIDHLRDKENRKKKRYRK